MIPVAEPDLDHQELDNLISAFKSGWISSKGEFIDEFEQAFASSCRVKYGLATCNGTASLHLALEALGIGKGDEVIVPSLTFIATANAVRYTGARPIFADIHPDYWCIDPEWVQKKISRKTKAIIPVHLYGHPCDMDPIIDLAKKYDLYIVEDAAEAHGAEYKGRKVGSFGDISCFSFYGNKIITTGEGGMCLTNDPQLAEKMRLLRDHGMNPNKRYWHDTLGFNYRMTNLQAALGVAQTNKLIQFIEKKRIIADWYREELKELAERGFITLHPEMTWAKCVYWMYSILVNDGFISRDQLVENLKEEGIETRPFFYPICRMPPYKNNEFFPIAEQTSATGFNLPAGTKLKREDIAQVASALEKALGVV